MNKNIKRISVVCLCILLSGCSMFQSALNDIKGNLVGNGYTIYTYDNYGSEVMETSGDKISITGNAVESTSYDEDGRVVRGYELSSVITITVDGKEIESCGDTCIFEQKGLTPDVDFTQEDIDSNTHGQISDNTSVARFINKYKNMFGKGRIVVIKSQLGQPIAAYSGDKVYWKIPDNLPKMTKLMIDGKALYIHRANFKSLIKNYWIRRNKMKQQISSTKGPKALGPYSAGIASEGLVFLSGQLGVNTEGNLVSEDVVEQTQKAFENIGVLLEASGLTYDDIVKTTVLLDDMNDFAKVNEEYAKYFDGIYPARSCFEVAALPKNAKVEIECIAIKK